MMIEKQTLNFSKRVADLSLDKFRSRNLVLDGRDNCELVSHYVHIQKGAGNSWHEE